MGATIFNVSTLYLFNYFLYLFAKKIHYFLMLLVVKCIFFAIIVLSLKGITEMSTEKVTRYRMFTFMQYLKHPECWERVVAKIKSRGSFRESLLKNGLTLSTIRPRSSQSSKPTAISTAETYRQGRWRSSSAYQRGY